MTIKNVKPYLPSYSVRLDTIQPQGGGRSEQCRDFNSAATKSVSECDTMDISNIARLPFERLVGLVLK